MAKRRSLDRLSVKHAEHFKKYFDLFIKYAPSRSFNIKQNYLKGFIEKKSANRIDSQKFYDSIKKELTERHLDPVLWSNWQKADEKRFCPDHPIWLATHAPKYVNCDAIDIDAKDYIIGYYGDPERKYCSLMPVISLGLSHIKKLKKLYDQFPERVWCISSATIGIHAWKHYKALQLLTAITAVNKELLHEIGLKSIEVHPMEGRCFRRPFGVDYSTITPNGLITDWKDQLDYFLNDKRTPSFQRICLTLVQKMTEQFKKWANSSTIFDDRKQALRLMDKVLYVEDKQIEMQTNIREIREWLNKKFSERIEQHIVSGDVLKIRINDSATNGEQHIISDDILKGRVNDFVPSSVVPNLNVNASGNKENWYKTVLDLAINGLVEDDSVHFAVYNLSKWLYFIELYDLDENVRVLKINELILYYITNKHNNFITRMNNGNVNEVIDHVNRSILSAIKVKDANSLELFSNIRNKISNNQYKTIIKISDAIMGKFSNQSPSLFNKCTPLPEELENLILSHSGLKKMFPFATILINKLLQSGCKANLGRQWMTTIAHSTPRKASERLKILTKAGIITVGSTYRPKEFGRLISLRPEIINQYWPGLAYR